MFILVNKDFIQYSSILYYIAGLAITRVILVLTSPVGKTGLNWEKLGLNQGKLGK